MKKTIFTRILLLLLLLAFAPFAYGQTYLEEPAHAPGDDTYVTVYAPLAGSSMRSFTYRYDKEKRVSLWVAYPLNNALIGTGTRSQDWLPDQAIPQNNQAILYKGFAYGSGYDRGHQIPSADRLTNIANQQTFIFTNATPQLHDFNGGIWAELEKLVRTWAKRSDTLYVVTGIIPGDKTIDDNVGNPVTIPSHYYKTVLRRNTDKRGKVHWSACSVILPHRVFPVGTWQQNVLLFKEHAISLADLEEMTGEAYFPLLTKEIDETEYNKLKSTNPITDPWWWR